MSYIMAFLLTQYPPYRAFKLFCNLVITNKFIYKTFIFKEKHIWNVNTMMEQIFARFHPALYSTFKELKVEIWSILWIEWVFTMFLKSFHLKACLVFWDFMLIKEESWIFRVSCVAFTVISDNFQNIRRDNVVEDCKRLIFENYGLILSKVLDEASHESEFKYIDGLIGQCEKEDITGFN
jgi:hypothetical protein